MSLVTTSYEETERLGRRFAKHLKSGMIVCFFGDLGTGKTTMIRGIAKGLGIDPESVHSPTFTVMNVYDKGKKELYHFDLYRLNSLEDLVDIGCQDFLYGEGISVIEWAEKLDGMLPPERLEIHLRHQSQDKRSIRVKAVGKMYDGFLEKADCL